MIHRPRSAARWRRPAGATRRRRGARRRRRGSASYFRGAALRALANLILRAAALSLKAATGWRSPISPYRELGKGSGSQSVARQSLPRERPSRAVFFVGTRPRAAFLLAEARRSSPGSGSGANHARKETPDAVFDDDN